MFTDKDWTDYFKLTATKIYVDSKTYHEDNGESVVIYDGEYFEGLTWLENQLGGENTKESKDAVKRVIEGPDTIDKDLYINGMTYRERPTDPECETIFIMLEYKRIRPAA